MMISGIYCGQSTNLGLLGSMSVVSRRSTVRHPVITKSRRMSEFGRVTVTTKQGQLSQIMTDFQSEQLDYDRREDRTRNLKHRSTLTLPLRHRSLNSLKILSYFSVYFFCFFLLVSFPSCFLFLFVGNQKRYVIFIIFIIWIVSNQIYLNHFTKQTMICVNIF